MRYAVIMAGGSGTRLWPLSRQGQPKQLLPLFEGRSLLQLAYDRAARLVEPDRILVCTGAPYAKDVRRQLPDLREENLLGEPVGRDSLNAAAWPAAVVDRRDPDAVMAVLTADQLISPADVFVERLAEGFAVAEADEAALVTFGVVPTFPHPGYGYLERGETLAGFPDAAHVVAFTEKPDAETARTYLATGRYWWNSGMFVWRAATFLRQIEALLPATYAAVRDLADAPTRLGEIFPALVKTSIDYAIMEPVSRGAGTAHVVAVALPIQWQDVGSFEALATVWPADASGNVVQGAAVVAEGRGNLVVNADDESIVALFGVDDLVVVRTPTATLVMPLARSQDVKSLVGHVAARHGDDLA
ncbi:MAG: sugar phosphate nucleotidyltransferase [Actinomycetia bacterium]|nr:sugar phosphate nucleotidyltransferase [Actinomycetes bacterium]